jgi:hypothetical protein
MQVGKHAERIISFYLGIFGLNLSYRKTGFNQTTQLPQSMVQSLITGVKSTSKDSLLRQILKHSSHH